MLKSEYIFSYPFECRYSDTLEDYLKTIIQFVARDKDFNPQNHQYYLPGMKEFDRELHFKFPMIKTTAKIKKFKEKNDDSGSKYDIYTKPSLMNI